MLLEPGQGRGQAPGTVYSGSLRKTTLTKRTEPAYEPTNSNAAVLRRHRLAATADFLVEVGEREVTVRLDLAAK